MTVHSPPCLSLPAGATLSSELFTVWTQAWVTWLQVSGHLQLQGVATGVPSCHLLPPISACNLAWLLTCPMAAHAASGCQEHAGLLSIGLSVLGWLLPPPLTKAQLLAQLIGTAVLRQHGPGVARAALISDVVGVSTGETMLEKPHFPVQSQPELPRTLQRSCGYDQGAEGSSSTPWSTESMARPKLAAASYLCQECWMTCGTPGSKGLGTGNLTQALLPARGCFLHLGSSSQPCC